MNVRSQKPWNTKHGVTQYFRFTVDMFFVWEFFISLVYVWLEKNYCIVYLYTYHTQTSQIDCFCSVYKILQWIRSSDFQNHVFLTKKLAEENKNNVLIFSVLPVKVKLISMASGKGETQLSLRAPPLPSPNRKIILIPITSQTSSVL